jgi:hypothetical protein
MSRSSGSQVRRSSRSKSPESLEDMFKGRTPSEMRAMTTVEDTLGFDTHAGQRLWTAAHWMQRMYRLIMVCSIISAVSGLLCIFALWSRETPLLLVTTPSGVTRCAPPPLNPKTLRRVDRPPSQSAQCAWIGRDTTDSLSSTKIP